MRYYRKHGQEFLENGISLLRVRTVAIFPDPEVPTRAMRVFQVEHAVRQSMGNAAYPGSVINLSFPKGLVKSASDYTWSRGERTQVMP